MGEGIVWKTHPSLITLSSLLSDSKLQLMVVPPSFSGCDSFAFKNILKYANLPTACQYRWNAAALISEPCRLVDTHREEQQPKGDQVQRRTRRHRTIFTEEQLDALEELFLQNQYPDVNTREKLAQQTNLREERVEVSQQLHLFLALNGDVWFSFDYVNIEHTGIL